MRKIFSYKKGEENLCFHYSLGKQGSIMVFCRTYYNSCGITKREPSTVISCVYQDNWFAQSSPQREITSSSSTLLHPVTLRNHSLLFHIILKPRFRCLVRMLPCWNYFNFYKLSAQTERTQVYCYNLIKDYNLKQKSPNVKLVVF